MTDNRGARRDRTENKKVYRDGQWADLYGHNEDDQQPRCSGAGRNRSHFDCGNTKCPTCHPDKVEHKPRKEAIEIKEYYTDEKT